MASFHQVYKALEPDQQFLLIWLYLGADWEPFDVFRNCSDSLKNQPIRNIPEFWPFESMDWILYQIDFFQKLKFLILSSLLAGLSFQTDALSWLSDWLPGRKRHPDRLLAPSSKHQFENLPGPSLEHLHPKTRSTSLFQPFWNWFYLFFGYIDVVDEC